eukprot:gene24319-26614_t
MRTNALLLRVAATLAIIGVLPTPTAGFFGLFDDDDDGFDAVTTTTKAIPTRAGDTTSTTTTTTLPSTSLKMRDEFIKDIHSKFGTQGSEFKFSALIGPSPNLLESFAVPVNIGSSKWKVDPDSPDSSYVYIENAKTWSEAASICASEDASLLSIKSEKEDAFVHRAILSQVAERNIWIGAADSHSEGSWVWQDGSSAAANNLTNSTFHKWRDGEPNDHKDGEDCAVVRGGAWNDLQCTLAYGFVCKKEALSCQGCNPWSKMATVPAGTVCPSVVDVNNWQKDHLPKGYNPGNATFNVTVTVQNGTNQALVVVTKANVDQSSGSWDMELKFDCQRGASSSLSSSSFFAQNVNSADDMPPPSGLFNTTYQFDLLWATEDVLDKEQELCEEFGDYCEHEQKLGGKCDCAGCPEGYRSTGTYKGHDCSLSSAVLSWFFGREECQTRSCEKIVADQNCVEDKNVCKVCKKGFSLVGTSCFDGALGKNRPVKGDGLLTTPYAVNTVKTCTADTDSGKVNQPGDLAFDPSTGAICGPAFIPGDYLVYLAVTRKLI